MPDRVDVALVSLGTTPGLRRADSAFAAQLRAAGVTCAVAPVVIERAGALRRHVAVTDLVEALAARRAPRPDARVVVFSTVTASLLQRGGPDYAVRFDSTAASNRPGVGGIWQRAAERRALARAKLLLPWSEAAAGPAPAGAARLAVPVPIEELPHAESRTIDAVAYAGDPQKRGLDAVCEAWGRAGAGRRLVVVGIDRARALSWLARRSVAEPPGVEWAGLAGRATWLAMLCRASVFLNGSRREDYGISQLEALSAGAVLVTVPSPGPYEALPLARRLRPDLVSTDLAAALTAGLTMDEGERATYRAAAGDALAPYRPAAVQRLVEDRVIPALLA